MQTNYLFFSPQSAQNVQNFAPNTYNLLLSGSRNRCIAKIFLTIWAGGLPLLFTGSIDAFSHIREKITSFRASPAYNEFTTYSTFAQFYQLCLYKVQSALYTLRGLYNSGNVAYRAVSPKVRPALKQAFLFSLTFRGIIATGLSVYSISYFFAKYSVSLLSFFAAPSPLFPSFQKVGIIGGIGNQILHGTKMLVTFPLQVTSLFSIVAKSGSLVLKDCIAPLFRIAYTSPKLMLGLVICDAVKGPNILGYVANKAFRSLLRLNHYVDPTVLKEDSYRVSQFKLSYEKPRYSAPISFCMIPVETVLLAYNLAKNPLGILPKANKNSPKISSTLLSLAFKILTFPYRVYSAI